MTSWLYVRSNCIVLADNGQMTGSLYKGASSDAQGDQVAVKTALINIKTALINRFSSPFRVTGWN